MKAHVQLDQEKKQAKIIVLLSERNLLTMLSKLASESNKTVFNTMVTGEEDWSGIFVLQAECDCIHYKDRIPPGPVREEDEVYVELMQSVQAVDPTIEMPKEKPCGCS